MNCSRTDLEGETRLRIGGALDALTVREIGPVIDSIVEDKRTRVVVELQELTLIDSSGVGAIVSLYKRVKADGGHVVVTGAREQPLAVLKLLKLDRVFGL